MKTQTYIICDCCGKIIVKETDGLIVQGNIYLANPLFPETKCGLIGNNFPAPDVDGKMKCDDVKAGAYHIDCLFDWLSGQINDIPQGGD